MYGYNWLLEICQFFIPGVFLFNSFELQLTALIVHFKTTKNEITDKDKLLHTCFSSGHSLTNCKQADMHKSIMSHIYI